MLFYTLVYGHSRKLKVWDDFGGADNQTSTVPATITSVSFPHMDASWDEAKMYTSETWIPILMFQCHVILYR